jgi:hypothetical protein
MPNREDEYWASEKEDLRYCSKHKRYYRKDIGCQLCWLEGTHENNLVSTSPKLQLCPACSKPSLFLDWRKKRFECLNLQCKRVVSLEDIFDPTTAETEPTSSLDRNTKPEHKIDTDSHPGQAIQNKPTLPQQPELKPQKCPTCLMVSLLWVSARKAYECQYMKCKATFTEPELAEIIKLRQAEPKGKAWFGDEYYDPKKKKWRKP